MVDWKRHIIGVNSIDQAIHVESTSALVAFGHGRCYIRGGHLEEIFVGFEYVLVDFEYVLV